MYNIGIYPTLKTQAVKKIGNETDTLIMWI